MRKISLFLCLVLIVGLFSGCFNKNKITYTPPSYTTPSVPTEPSSPPPQPPLPPEVDPPTPPDSPIVLPTPLPVTSSLQWCSTGETLNFRAGPSYGSTLIGQVPASEHFTILEWDHEYAKIEYNGTIGYVSVAYIRPADQEGLEDHLPVVKVTDTYTYDQMIADIATLTKAYPDILQVSSIGESE